MADLRKITLTTGGFEDVDPNTGAGLGTFRRGLTSLDKELRSLENVIKSASNSFQFFNENLKSIDKKTGLAQQSFYINPSDTANVLSALKQFNSFLAQRKVNAGTFAVTREDVDVYETARKIYGTRAQRKAIESISNVGGTATVNARNQDILDIMLPVKQGQSKEDSSKYLGNILRQAMKYSNAERDTRNQEDRERQEKEDRKREAKEATESKRTTHKLIMSAIGTLTLISNLIRRLVTASFAQATADTIRARQAHDLQLTAGEVRQYEVAERVHGLTTGTILGGAQAFQNAFGDVNSLDGKKIEQLAFVLGEGVANDVRSGLPSGKRPSDLMQEALTSALARYEAGEGYLGTKMGSKEEARRSLVDWAGRIDENFATILSQMIEDREKGLFKFSDFNSWLTSAIGGQTVSSRIDDSTENALYAFTSQINAASANLQDLAEMIKLKVVVSLSDLVNKVANIDFGKSATQKLETQAEREAFVTMNIESMRSNVTGAEAVIRKTVGSAYNDLTLNEIISGVSANPFNELYAAQARQKLLTSTDAMSAAGLYKVLAPRLAYYDKTLKKHGKFTDFNALDWNADVVALKAKEVFKSLFYTTIYSQDATIVGAIQESTASKLATGDYSSLDANEQQIVEDAFNRMLGGKSLGTYVASYPNSKFSKALMKGYGVKDSRSFALAYNANTKKMSKSDILSAFLDEAQDLTSASGLAVNAEIESRIKEAQNKALITQYINEQGNKDIAQQYAKQGYTNLQYGFAKAGDRTVKVVLYGNINGKETLLKDITPEIEREGVTDTTTRVDAANIYSQN